jgi:cytochrome P450
MHKADCQQKAALFLGHAYYNLYLHPLRSFPGPRLAAVTEWWRTLQVIKGRFPQKVRQLHERHGPVVRIGVNELSFIDSQAWKDIAGHHGAYEMEKDPKFYRIFGGRGAPQIINADRALHSMLRRQMSHGFSDRSMRAQEPIIGSYVDLLVQRLGEHSEGGTKPVDMRAWLNFATFDIIGNLGFGSDFGCLEKSYYHPWVDAIANNIKEGAIMRLMVQMLPKWLLYAIAQSGLLKGRTKALGWSKDKIAERLNMGERDDLVEGLIKKKDVLSTEELEANAFVLVFAGSETTATVLSGFFFLIGSHPEVLAKLTKEVRSSFNNEEEITLTSVGQLEYMLACLDEALRMYPPVPIGMPRVVPKGGFRIAGHMVPEDTSVAVWQLAAHYSERNFTEPEKFHPERWLSDEKFASDDLAARQPFSVGPRNCIGRNLAYAEMRLIVARILYRYDVELSPGSEDWIKTQKAYTLWVKPELPMYLKPARTVV